MSFKGEKEGDLRAQSADFFLLNPPRQPKQEIASYAESKGILVPYRFANLDQALASGKPFIVRSEHPQDYDGASDLLRSFKITKEWVDVEKAEHGSEPEEIDWTYVFSGEDATGRRLEAEGRVIAQLGNVSQEKFEDSLKHLSTQEVLKYCKLLNIDPKNFFSETSYSYWELMGGCNRIIVADNVVSNRYHIFSSSPSEYRSGSSANYAMFENGEIIVSKFWEQFSKADAPTPSLIDLYESVRNLEPFDKRQCPIIEVQTVNGVDYFLQYHRAADFNLSRFSLKRKKKKDEIEAAFVRGATPKEGIVITTNVYSEVNKHVLKQEDGGFDFHYDRVFAELMARRRLAQFFYFDDLDDLETMRAHSCASLLCKTPISLGLKRDDVDNILLDGENSYGLEKVKQIVLWVVSDGRKAYVEKLSKLT